MYTYGIQTIFLPLHKVSEAREQKNFLSLIREHSTTNLKEKIQERANAQVLKHYYATIKEIHIRQI